LEKNPSASSLQWHPTLHTVAFPAREASASGPDPNPTLVNGKNPSELWIRSYRSWTGDRALHSCAA